MVSYGRGVVLRIDDRGVRSFLNNLPIKINKEMDSEMNRFANDTVKAIQVQMTRKKLVWKSPHLRDSFKVIKQRKGQYDVTARKEAIHLDSARPHWVSIYPKTGGVRKDLRDWARQKLGYAPRHIYVRPHPYLDAPISRQMAKLNQYLDRGMTNATKR